MFNYLVWFNREQVRKKNIVRSFSFDKETLVVESFSQDTLFSLGEFFLIKGKVYQNRQATVSDNGKSFLGFALRSEEENDKQN